MKQRNALAHAMYDLGLAAWFGGSLMGAVGVNGAAADVADPRQQVHLANAGWGRWTPVNLVAITVHLLGGAQLMRANRGHAAPQRGVFTNPRTRLALTAGALGATVYARVLGQRIEEASDLPLTDQTEALTPTPAELAKARKQLVALQWAIPGLTGAVLAGSSVPAPQPRRSQVIGEALRSLPSTVGSATSSAATLAKAAAQDVKQRAQEAR